MQSEEREVPVDSNQGNTVQAAEPCVKDEECAGNAVQAAPADPCMRDEESAISFEVCIACYIHRQLFTALS